MDIIDHGSPEADDFWRRALSHNQDPIPRSEQREIVLAARLAAAGRPVAAELHRRRAGYAGVSDNDQGDYPV